MPTWQKGEQSVNKPLKYYETHRDNGEKMPGSKAPSGEKMPGAGPPSIANGRQVWENRRI